MECTVLRVKPNINYESGVIMMFQCRFTDCNKCASLMGDVDSQGGCVFIGVLHFLFNFAVNLKLLLKNSF